MFANSDLELVDLLTLIGQVITLIENQLLDMCLCLQMDQLAGQVRNKVQLHFHLQRSCEYNYSMFVVAGNTRRVWD